MMPKGSDQPSARFVLSLWYECDVDRRPGGYEQFLSHARRAASMPEFYGQGTAITLVNAIGSCLDKEV